QLAVGDRVQQRHVRRDGLLDVAAAAVALLVPHAGEEQLLTILVGLDQADPARSSTDAVREVAALLVTQPAGAVIGQGDDLAAGGAGGPVLVVLPPRLAAHTDPAEGAGHSPGVAVRTRVDGDLPLGQRTGQGPRLGQLPRRVRVAAGAQPGGVVPVGAAALVARRWGDRATRPAPEAVRDLPHRRWSYP